MNLKRLATQLNLSVTTVSRALNGYPEVSEATRRRVAEVAREAGYVPNRVAQRLQKGRAEAVGVVLPLQVGHFGDPFFAELLVGLGERLHLSDIDLVVTTAPVGPEEMQAYRRLVEGRRIDALIVGRTRLRDERIRYLLDRGFPFVAHGRTEIDRPYAHLDMDSEQGFQAACRHLIGLGHRRIALVNAPRDLYMTHIRHAGYRRALEEAGLAADPALVLDGDMTERGGAESALSLLKLPAPPTAILFANDPMAIGAIRAVRRSGRRIPDDLSIVGYDDLPMAAFTEPALTTLRQPVQAAGRRLADMLLALVAGAPAESLQEIWIPELIVRGSAGRPGGTR